MQTARYVCFVLFILILMILIQPLVWWSVRHGVRLRSEGAIEMQCLRRFALAHLPPCTTLSAFVAAPRHLHETSCDAA